MQKRIFESMCSILNDRLPETKNIKQKIFRNYNIFRRDFKDVLVKYALRPRP